METKIFLVYGLEPRNFNRLTEWKPEILSGLQNGKWKYYPVYRMKPRNLTRKQKNYFEDQKKHTKFNSNLEPQTNNQIPRQLESKTNVSLYIMHI